MIAQMAERLTTNSKVPSSSPRSGSNEIIFSKLKSYCLLQHMVIIVMIEKNSSSMHREYHEFYAVHVYLWSIRISLVLSKKKHKHTTQLLNFFVTLFVTLFCHTLLELWDFGFSKRSTKFTCKQESCNNTIFRKFKITGVGERDCTQLR